jgi:26S proteasome regulatory subunit N11
MLKHGRAGVPMEVMGLMLGEFVDDYTVRVIDVFAMPQSGTVIKISSIFLFLITLKPYLLVHGLKARL